MTDRSTRQFRLLSVAPLLLALVASAAPAQMPEASSSDLKSDMRKLWEDHITWTRLYIVTTAANLPEREVTAERLMKNQEDIGKAIKPYYGEPAGDKLTGLLKSHISIAAEIIDAAMKSDQAKQGDASKRWNANADEIAAFLNGANPANWPLADVKKMLHEHLDLTTEEVVAHLHQEWTKSVDSYDKIHEQILMMADALSSGILKQFPQKAN